MSAGSDSLQAKAEFLTHWIRPERIQDFQASYELVAPAGEARGWAVIVAMGGEQVVAEASLEAAGKGFIDRLAEEIANRERAAGRPKDEIVEMLAAVTGKQVAKRRVKGEMHAIIDQLSGLMDETALFAAAEAARACAVVYHGNVQKGTAFLVRNDMVLTAAHVALGTRSDNANDPWLDDLAEGLSFSFRAPPNRPPAARVTVLPATRGALRKFSKPFGTVNDLRVDLQPANKPTFDYALIQLAESVNHLVPIEVDPPSAVEKGNKCWAMGFPGGTALKLDYDKVVDDSIGGGRWLHRANAARGMSGGCCINHQGKLAGVHEGAIETDLGEGPKKYNRGVAIAEIRKDQLAGGSDPMTARTSTPGIGFDDSQMVADLWRAGAALSNAMLAPVWDGAMRSVFPAGNPGDLASLPGFHPWFERKALRDWASSDSPRERLCLISGPRGAGASFCKHLLRARLGGAGLSLFEVSPTQVAAFDPAEAIGVAVAPSANRTSAASFRYVDAKQLIDQMRPSGGGSVRPCTVAIDFGPDGGPDRLVGSKWQEFIVQLLAEEWIRVVLIGLSRDEQILLAEALLGRSETETLRATTVSIEPIGGTDLEDFAIALRDARGLAQKVPLSELRQRINAVVGSVQGLTIELQTVKFTLAAILLERGLKLQI